MTTTTPGPVVVWGNCQAPPIAALVREPMAAHGLEVLEVPTVFEATAEQVAEVRDVMRRAAVLVTQPVRDEYRHAGCGSEQLAALLPASGQVVRIPSAFHTGWLPFQANAHDEGGDRVPAPLVEYHDLRLLAAAERGQGVAEVLEAWPGESPAEGIREAAAASVAELQRREQHTDIAISDVVDTPDALFAMNHPSNRVLTAMADRVLDHLGLPGRVTAPEREFLGAVRSPLELQVVAARGAGSPRPLWRVWGADVPWEDVVTEHLALYRARPGIVRDARSRWAGRFATLAL